MAVVPIRYTVSTVDLSADNGFEVENAVEKISVQDEGGSRFWQKAYIITVQYWGRQPKEYCILPYITYKINDVGTAGTGTWEFTFCYLGFIRRNDSLVQIHSFNLQPTEVSIVANENTVFYDGGSYRGNQIAKNVSATEYDDKTRSQIVLNVATKDSSGLRDEDSEIIFSWGGELALPANLFLLKPISFQLNGYATYVNNAS